MTRARRPLRGLGLALPLLLALASAAQTPDVPAGSGLVRGRVLLESGAAPGSSLPVLLYALSASGEPGIRETASDAAGEFRFAGVSTDPGTVYLIGTRIGEVPFGARAAFAPGQSELEVELRVAETSSDASAIRVGEARLQLDWGCSGLRLSESIELRNPGATVLYIPEAERAGAEPILRWQLPERAAGFQSALGSFEQGVELVGSELRFWGPLHPGSRALEFLYDVPAAERIPFERRFARGAERVTLLVHGAASPLSPGPGFRPEADVVRGDARHAAASSGALAAGSALRFELPAPPRPDAAASLALDSAEIWLELDDATLRADEAFALEVAGGAALSGAGSPLLCLELPEGVSDLRFSNETLALGLESDAGGALALRGPLPAGRSELRIRYQLPVSSNPVRFARRFPLALPVARLLVADTGVVPETRRLHRLQSVAVADRSYAHLEGLAFEAGEELAVDLRRIQLGAGLPRGVSLALVGAGGLLALLLLSAPLRDARGRVADAAPDAGESGAAREREALYAAIADLDHDFETGKLSPEDHERMRDELRARAVALLRSERAQAGARGSGASAPERALGETAPAQRRCSACAAPVEASARFCSHCGARLFEIANAPRAGGA